MALALLLVGCGAHGSTATAPATPPPATAAETSAGRSTATTPVAPTTTEKTSSPTAPAAAPLRPVTFCSALVRAAEARLASLPADHSFVKAWRETKVCVATRDEAWGLSLDSVEVKDAGLWARWSLRHLRAQTDGTPSEAVPFAPDTSSPPTGAGAAADREAPSSAMNLVWTDERRILPASPTVFDFDGDGAAEAVVVVQTTETNEAGLTHATRRGRVWTAAGVGGDGQRAGGDGDGAGGTIGLYPPARGILIEDARDVDGDGRPDLVTRGPYEATAVVTCGSEDPYPVTGPPLLAHALPGGDFSLDDAAAASFARSACAAPPRPPLVRAPGSPGAAGEIDLAASARNVACARLWNAPTGKLVSAIRAACRRPPGAACAPCDDAALLERWASLPPPLSLSPARPRSQRATPAPPASKAPTP